MPVFVVDPDKPMGIPVRDGDSRRRRAFDDTAAAMIKAADTLVPQAVPPGSGENAVGRGGVPLERGVGGRRVRISTNPTGNDDKDKDKGKSTTQAARKELLDKYDTNKDGRIDKEERAKMSAEDKKAWAHAGDHKKGKKGDKEKAKAQ